MDETPLQRRRRLNRENQARYRFERYHNNRLLVDNLTFNENRNEHHFCGLMNIVCNDCRSLNFLAEKSLNGKFNNCCHKGKVLPPGVDLNGVVQRPDFPAYLKDLMTNPHNPHYQNFKTNIRSFNSALSFASMGAQIAHVPGHGPYCFRVHGQVYHRTSHIHPEDGQARQYAQLYVIDSNEATEQRLQNQANNVCNPTVMAKLDILFRQINVFAMAYKTMREVESEELEKASRDNNSIPVVNMVFRKDRNEDRRRYNLPTVQEIAMIFRTTDGEPPFERDIRVYPRYAQQPFISLQVTSPNLDPMTYAVLYPFGEAGWQPKMQINLNGHDNAVRRNISMLQWKVSQTAIRENIFNPILHGGKLFQQWVVDSHLQVEANNLYFVRSQQNKLRVERYIGLIDHLNNISHEQTAQVGRMVILPSSFQGSPRNMRERFHDAMAIVGKKGPPDIFLTITCNPNWPEIKDNLFPGQQSSDRPDLVARVFKIKLSELMDDILKKNIFGKVAGYVYAIEFQKRGLPHAHILLILSEKDKPNNEDKIDRFVCAEIPDPNNEPKLFEIVKTCMVHGPCGGLNPNASCMENGRCVKKFPKEFRNQTYANVDGYPLYRRREGREIQVRQFTIDNRYIVPYNKYLSFKFNCHINVEICASIKSVKYIFKYVYKGYDAARVEVQDNGQIGHDEISNYIDARYVSAPEAMWRLLENKMHDKSHHIIRLAVHLEQEQTVYFEEGHEEEALNRAEVKETTLTAWFNLNKNDVAAKELLYIDVPYHYVFHGVSQQWKRRQKGKEQTIARMYSVSPRDEERFYLRLLLLHVRGAQTFSDVRTVDGVVCNTYREAAVRRHLLEDDTEWIRCLEEAAISQMPKQLRQTFALICVFNSPKNPFDLWERFCGDMIKDYQRNHINDIAEKSALQDIEETLRLHSYSCVKLGLPEPGHTLIHEYKYNHLEECAIATEQVNTLNTLQKYGYDQIMHSICNKNAQSRFFFLDGPGGSGKTYLYNVIMRTLRGKGMSVLPFATTGIAADLLRGGRTVHSGFKLPVPVLETSVSLMRMQSTEAQKIRNAALLIVDEASMLSSNALRCIDLLLKEIAQNNLPFGGKVLLLGGDFRQTSNVVRQGSNAEIIESCIKSSPLWNHVKCIILTTNMRSAGQDEFNEWILNIGNGTLQNEHQLGQDVIEIPQNMIVTKNIVGEIYGEQIDVSNDEALTSLSKKIILTPKNKDALSLNQEVIKLIPDHEQMEYISADSIVSEDEAVKLNFPIEFLNTLTPSGMPPHKLILKTGAIVMLIRNLNSKRGLLNGTRLIIKSLHNYYIEADVLTGSNRGERVFIPRIDLAPSETNLPFILKRRQFPIILAFVITINKSQGQTFDKVGVFLPEPVFAHGQLYVALSRTRDKDCVKVSICEDERQGQLMNDHRVFTRNVVLRELLKS